VDGRRIMMFVIIIIIFLAPASMSAWSLYSNKDCYNRVSNILEIQDERERASKKFRAKLLQFNSGAISKGEWRYEYSLWIQAENSLASDANRAYSEARECECL
jgi:hypothetical protein